MNIQFQINNTRILNFINDKPINDITWKQYSTLFWVRDGFIWRQYGKTGRYQENFLIKKSFKKYWTSANYKKHKARPPKSLS